MIEDTCASSKLISLVNCQKYVRHRDIWDLRWLKQKKAQINIEYIKSKVKDYSVENYLGKLDARIEDIKSIVEGKAFNDEVTRFIPIDVQTRTLKKERFLSYLANEITTMLQEVKSLFE